tara:strand:+ start:1727 stop:2389 length:663 start_codon:yes stop_codon:yes gene_type:complete
MPTKTFHMIQVHEQAEYDDLVHGFRGRSFPETIQIEHAITIVNQANQNNNAGCGWFVNLTYVSGSSNKFYAGGKDQDGFFIRYGRNGTSGTRKSHTSWYSVIEKLNEKTAKGYRLNSQVKDLPNSGATKTHTHKMSELFQNRNQLDFEFSVFNGEPQKVDLSGFGAMFALVKAVRWNGDAFKGLNGDASIIMTIPNSVVEDARFTTMSGNRIPPMTKKGA